MMYTLRQKDNRGQTNYLIQYDDGSSGIQTTVLNKAKLFDTIDELVRWLHDHSVTELEEDSYLELEEDSCLGNVEIVKVRVIHQVDEEGVIS